MSAEAKLFLKPPVQSRGSEQGLSHPKMDFPHCEGGGVSLQETPLSEYTSHHPSPNWGAGTDPTLQSRKLFFKPTPGLFFPTNPSKIVGNYSAWLFRWFPPPHFSLQSVQIRPLAASHSSPLAAGTTAWHSLGPGLRWESVCLRFPLQS